MRFFLTLLWSLVLIASSAVAQDNYRIKPGDTVSIEVLEDSSLNRALLVLPDGTVNFPFAGAVRVSGRTTSDVQQVITSGIAGNFASPPTVFVSVASVSEAVVSAPVRAEPVMYDIYFIGEINQPGLISMEPGTTFLQAIAQSGGFTRFAATKRVQLRRTDATTKQQIVYTLNYKALGDGARVENNLVLQDGDIILVPERRLFE